MWGYVTAIVFTLWCLYLAIKYGFKPYLRMLNYTKYKGAIMMPFSPILGPFQQSQESFQLTGDEHFFNKKTFEDHPEARFFIFNAFDKCFLLLVDPSLLQQLFQKQQHYIKDEEFVKNKFNFFGKGFVFSQVSEWSRRRKTMSDIFHHSFFNKFIPKVCTIVQRQMATIRGHNLQDFQAKRLSAVISGDTVVKTFFGQSFSQKINGKPLAVYLDILIKDIMSQQHSLRYFLFGVKILEMGLFPEDKIINSKLDKVKMMLREQITKSMKDQHLEEGSVLRGIRDEKLFEGKEGYTLDGLVEEFLGFFVAGTETTGHLITMCFYYLSFYPQYQKVLREEVENAGALQKLDFRSIMSMKFLEAFVKETFRHFNYMVSTFPRICQKSHSLGEIQIQEGDIVIPGWAHSVYNQKYFPNPDNFDPERWLKSDQKELNYIFMPLSAGSRSCLGQNFALLQSKIVLIKMVGQFRMKLKEGTKSFLKSHAFSEPVSSIIIDVADV